MHNFSEHLLENPARYIYHFSLIFFGTKRFHTAYGLDLRFQNFKMSDNVVLWTESLGSAGGNPHFKVLKVCSTKLMLNLPKRMSEVQPSIENF